MRPLIFALLVMLGLVATAAEPEHGQYIEVSADVPTVTIAPRKAGRYALRLPSLTYLLRLRTNCANDWRPTSVSVSIADSRRAFASDELTDEELELEIHVPSSQIAPLRLEEFCVADDQTPLDHAAKLTVPAALSAQVSLRCAMQSQQSIRYVTKPLDVTLECGAPE